MRWKWIEAINRNITIALIIHFLFVRKQPKSLLCYIFCVNLTLYVLGIIISINIYEFNTRFSFHDELMDFTESIFPFAGAYIGHTLVPTFGLTLLMNKNGGVMKCNTIYLHTCKKKKNCEKERPFTAHGNFPALFLFICNMNCFKRQQIVLSHDFSLWNKFSISFLLYIGT